MAITQTFDKRRLIITLGENEAPASWVWEGVTYTRNDDESDAAPPFSDKKPATTEEVAAHIGQASADQAAAFERFNGQLADRDNQIADLTSQNSAVSMERDALRSVVNAVTAAVAPKQ